MPERGRPKKDRNISVHPNCTCFKPSGIDPETAEKIELRADELECLELKDIKGMGIIEGAEKMGVSKSTFANTYNEAHRKVSDALINGKVILFNCK